MKKGEKEADDPPPDNESFQIRCQAPSFLKVRDLGRFPPSQNILVGAWKHWA